MALQKRSSVHKLGELAKVNDIVEQTFYFEQKVYEWNNKIKDNKKIISKAIGRKSKLEIKVEDNLTFIALKNVKTNIEFFKDQLKKKLTKEQYKKITNKTIIIDDINAVITLLKSHGVPPKDFKKYISSHETINEEAIDEMIELGEVEIDDLQGCYKADFDENIQIKRIKT